jgi:OmpA-OmpF porin, OOP family
LASANGHPDGKDMVNQRNNFKSSDFAWTAGAEFWFTGNIGVYARYIGGTSNINARQGNGISLPIYPPITNSTSTEIKNSAWQFGLTIGFRNKVEAPVVVIPAAPVVIDTDGDGIPDNVDKCPTVAGVAKYNGCPIPDTDGDGINDELDKCPTVAGVAKYNGCPIPDTDGDGINDENDKCPTVAGIAKYNGCPIPDTDGDGINDEEDKCPNVAGTASNFGCPDMTLYYKRAESKLSASDKLSLDSVVTFMNNNPDVKIIVQGYTSTLGATAYNQKLSEARAANSVKYMVSKGIDASRMKSVGFGETSPVAGSDQSTEAGRAVNRRTVIQIEKE